MKMKDHPRTRTLFILNKLDKERKTLDNILENTPEDASFSRRDQALTHALTYGVLRWRSRLDLIIGHFSKTPLNKMDSRILNVLRIGVFQMLYLDKIPVSAAVNTSVEMAKSFSSPWVVRFVNGLLRNIARKYESVPFPDMGKDPISALAAEKSFPKWLVRRWLRRFGTEETARLCDAVNSIPPITIRTNTIKTTREELMISLEAEVGEIDPTPHARDGISFSHPKMPVAEMKTFQKGWFQVQDEAAQLVSQFLNPQPGENILDACAGFGGKTGHIAQLMKNQGRIVAMDKDGGKLLRLKSETERLGISIVRTCVHDLQLPYEKESDFAGFDRILLDAPCSGLGVLRRNPDAKWSVSEKNLDRCKKRQSVFLNHLAPLLSPRGVLVYAVCSTETEENEAVTEAFLEAGDLRFEIRNSESSYLRTFPHRDHMDGFFAVRFRRIR